MPTYDYQCDSCNYTFEIFQNMSDEKIKICPKCGENVRRVIHGGTGIIFKGSGFYVNDYAKKDRNPQPEKAPKSDSAPSASSVSSNDKETTPPCGKKEPCAAASCVE
ncbi:MAG: FmdB family zinc ribbon protein [bacterium]